MKIFISLQNNLRNVPRYQQCYYCDYWMMMAMSITGRDEPVFRKPGSERYIVWSTLAFWIVFINTLLQSPLNDWHGTCNFFNASLIFQMNELHQLLILYSNDWVTQKMICQASNWSIVWISFQIYGPCTIYCSIRQLLHLKSAHQKIDTPS